jgi:Uma2 family endonuclease
MLMVTLATRRGFTATEYHQMAEAGILTEDDRIELIAGEIVEMSAIGALHVNCVNALDDILHRLVGRDMTVSVQNPIRLQFDTEPEPDIAIVTASSDRRRVLTPKDMLLLIEVADSSLEYDRGTKLPLYARSGIAEAWIVDLDGQTIERHTEPQGGAYLRVVSAQRGDTIASTTLPAVALDVNAVLG